MQMKSNLTFTLSMTEDEAKNLWRACNEALSLRGTATVGAKCAFTVSLLETAIQRLVHETKPLSEARFVAIMESSLNNNERE